MKHIILVLALLFSCNEPTIKSKQLEIVNNYLSGQIEYDYYNDTIIKEAYIIDESGQKKGRILQFGQDGALNRIFFINYKGDTVGDESIFLNGRVSKHYFYRNSEILLFYAKFYEGQFIRSEGKPFFLSVESEIAIDDTVDFYIATPIIPGYQTELIFGQVGEEESIVKHKNKYNNNELEQFRYKRKMSNKGSFDFCLQVQIIDSQENIIIKELDTTTIIVNER